MTSLPMPLLTRRALLAAGVATTVSPRSPRADSESPKLYYSDYISFVGSDAQGTVYLAHDSNRGRTGERYFADHWISMYADGAGWIPVQGSAHYPNPSKALDHVPASDHFTFTGKPLEGLRMVGTSNDMELVVDPLVKQMHRENADGIFWIGGAPAVMTWRGRKLVGRVLFEYLQRHNSNRFTEVFEAKWNNFNGLYLLTDSGHDFYMHSHDRVGGSDLNGRLVGSASWAKPAPVDDLTFKITKSDDVPYRSYRLPSGWQCTFTYDGRPWTLDLASTSKQLFADWTAGGFFMSTARGTITSADGNRRMSVVGLAELLL